MERDDTCGLLSTINVPYLFEFVRGHIVGRPVLRHDSEIARRDRNAIHFELTPMLTNVSIQIVQICINERLESSSNQANNLNDTSKNTTAELKCIWWNHMDTGIVACCRVDEFITARSEHYIVTRRLDRPAKIHKSALDDEHPQRW